MFLVIFEDGEVRQYKNIDVDFLLSDIENGVITVVTFDDVFKVLDSRGIWKEIVMEEAI